MGAGVIFYRHGILCEQQVSAKIQFLLIRQYTDIFCGRQFVLGALQVERFRDDDLLGRREKVGRYAAALRFLKTEIAGDKAFFPVGYEVRLAQIVEQGAQVIAHGIHLSQEFRQTGFHPPRLLIQVGKGILRFKYVFGQCGVECELFEQFEQRGKFEPVEKWHKALAHVVHHERQMYFRQ